MTPVTYLRDQSQIAGLLEFGVSEVILEPEKLSRFGKLSLKETNEFIGIASAKGLKVFIEWDILMVGVDFLDCTEYFRKIDLQNVAAVRVQDPGAIHWCLENTDKNLHLILETGNHNLIGLNSWLDLDRKRIERIILSIEWSKNQLKELIPKVNCPIEFLGMGRILLFYTPRYLLKNGLKERENTLEVLNSSHWIEASGQSEESPHKGFPLLENRHGTFMFLPSDHCLLDHLEELKELGISFVRLDNRFIESNVSDQMFAQFKDPSEEGFSKLKELSVSRLIRGFYNSNKSDVLFKKLKNHRIQRKDEKYLGQVLEVNKKNYLALKLKNPKEELKVGSALKILTPEGKTKILEVKFLKNCSGQPLERASAEEVVFVNHVGGVSTRAAVYFC